MSDNKRLERFSNLFSAYCNENYNELKTILNNMSEESFDFASYIDDYLYKHNISKKLLLQKAYIQIKYGYKILNGTKHTTNRDIILRICLAAGMTLEETNKCLYLNGMSSLEHYSKRDSLIICAIKTNGKLRLENLNDALIELGFTPLID